MTPVDDGRSADAPRRLAQTPRAPEPLAPARTPAPRRTPARLSVPAPDARALRATRRVTAALVGTCVLLSGCASVGGDRWPAAPLAAASPGLPAELPLVPVPEALGDAELEPYVSTVARRSVVEPGSWHLAAGLAPPTNRWFSPLALASAPQPVMPLPFAVTVGGGGLALSIPTGATSAGAGPALAIDAGARSWLVTGYTDASVTVTLHRAGVALAEVVLTRGSPVIGYRALVDHRVTVDALLTPAAPGLFSTALGDTTLGLVGARVVLDPGGRSFTLPAGASANWVAVPEGSTLAALAPFAVSTITDVAVSFLVVPDLTTTTVQFAPAAGEPVLFGVLDRLGRRVTSPTGAALDCRFGRFDTPEGGLRVCAGQGFSYAVATVDPFAAVALSALTGAERAALLRSLSNLPAQPETLPRSVALAASELARLATLLRLARETNDAAAIERVSAQARNELVVWSQLDGCAVRADQCFAFDPALHGMVAFDASAAAVTGDARLAQEGAFLFAAGVVAEGDAALTVQLRPMMTLLAADLAASASSAFAARRAFDPVAGHSWSSCAAGLSATALDEPCPEPRALDASLTLAAYSGVAAWATAAGDPWLLDQITWMLSVEQHAATHPG